MTGARVNQTGSSAGQDIVGGNKNETTINLGNNSEKRIARIQKIVERLHVEMENDQHFHDIVQNLAYFEKSVDDANVDPIGIEAKLDASGRSFQKKAAIRYKEEFVKLRERYGLYRSAQDLFAYFLSKIEVSFHQQIVPRIASGESQTVIDNLIMELIIHSVAEELPDCEFLVNYVHIQGMLYYLGDMCHVRWDGY